MLLGIFSYRNSLSSRMKICAPPPPPPAKKKRFNFLWSTVGIFTLFLGPRAPGQGWSLWGPLVGVPMQYLVGEWGERGLVLSQALRTPLSCLGLSVPTRPLGGARIGGLKVLGKSMRHKIFWDYGLTFSQHPTPPPPTASPSNTHTHTHSPEQSIFISLKLPETSVGTETTDWLAGKSGVDVTGNYSGPVPLPALVSFPP